MADIELVIKIDEEKYDVIKSDLYNTFPAEMKEWGLEALKNGTPLPKGHGDLIDVDNIIGKIHGVRSITAVLDAPTIIEADKAESEAE